MFSSKFLFKLENKYVCCYNKKTISSDLKQIHIDCLYDSLYGAIDTVDTVAVLTKI